MTNGAGGVSSENDSPLKKAVMPLLGELIAAFARLTRPFDDPSAENFLSSGELKETLEDLSVVHSTSGKIKDLLLAGILSAEEDDDDKEPV